MRTPDRHEPPLAARRRGVLLALLPAAAVAGAAACGELGPAGPFDDNGDAPTLLAEGDVLSSMLAPDPDVAGAVRTPAIPVDPGAARAGLRFDADGELALEGRASLDGGETFGPWIEGAVTWREGIAGNAHVDLPEGATDVQLRLRLAAGGRVLFLAVESFVVSTEREESADDAWGTAQQGLAADGVAVSRSSWGSRSTSCSSRHTPSMMTVHHTVTPTNDSIDMPARVRQIQAYHMDSRGYCDVGYHFLVGQDGQVYQGRVETYLGAHAGGANTDNAGVSYIGTFSTDAVPQAMMDAGARMLRSIANTYGIPLDRTHVKGHREVGTTATACPGDVLFGRLDELIALARNDQPPPPANRAPHGYLDVAECDRIAGWSQDPDAPDAPISVHVYVGGPAGHPDARGFAITANGHRDDLCGAIGSCAHAYGMPVPGRFRDGAPHEVYAYGIDSAGGQNTLLANSPRSVTCAPPSPPLSPDDGVRRHVTSPEVLAAWGLSFDDVAALPDDVVNAFADGAPVDGPPRLVRAEGEPAVWLVDRGNRRHVSSPDVMAAWHFSWDAIEARPAAEVNAWLQGHAILPAPFVFRGSGPAVYLLEHNPPLTARVASSSVPESVPAGATARAVLRFRNAGSVAWTPGPFRLGTQQPQDADSPLCDADTWLSCNRAATFGGPVAPGETGELSFLLRGPAGGAGTTVHACFGLLYESVAWFKNEGQGGPAADALCFDVRVTPAGTSPPPDPADPNADPSAPEPATTDPQPEDPPISRGPGERLPTGDDAPSASEVPQLSDPGGCNAAGGSPAAALGFVLAAVVLRRRRAADRLERAGRQ